MLESAPYRWADIWQTRHMTSARLRLLAPLLLPALAVLASCDRPDTAADACVWSLPTVGPPDKGGIVCGDWRLFELAFVTCEGGGETDLYVEAPCPMDQPCDMTLLVNDRPWRLAATGEMNEMEGVPVAKVPQAQNAEAFKALTEAGLRRIAFKVGGAPQQELPSEGADAVMTTVLKHCAAPAQPG